MKTVARVQHVTKFFSSAQGRVTALGDVSFEISSGQLAAVQGPSGSGKTTLLLAMGGLLELDQGRVCVDGKEVHALSAGVRARFRATNIGYVFQQFHLVPYLSVRENVLLATIGKHCGGSDERAEELIIQLGLERRARHLPGELSTGERQRTALARALLNRPALLLADEPTGNLDQENAHKVWQCLKTYADEGGAVLVATHDTGVAKRCDRLLRLNEGRLS